jgi:hypothetical protein
LVVLPSQQGFVLPVGRLLGGKGEADARSLLFLRLATSILLASASLGLELDSKQLGLGPRTLCRRLFLSLDAISLFAKMVDALHAGCLFSLDKSAAFLQLSLGLLGLLTQLMNGSVGDVCPFACRRRCRCCWLSWCCGHRAGGVGLVLAGSGGANVSGAVLRGRGRGWGRRGRRAQSSRGGSWRTESNALLLTEQPHPLCQHGRGRLQR